MRFKIAFLFTIFHSICTSYFASNDDTLYINRDTINLGSFLTHFTVFNSDSVFSPKNHVISAQTGETIKTTIINRDSLPHTFTINNIITSNNTIQPGDTMTFSYSFSNAETYRYYSEMSYGYLLSASGQIFINDDSFSKYYWNLFDQSASVSEDLANNLISSIPNNYFSNVYTINNRIYPDVLSDTTAVITGSVNDSILISIVNSGKMAHCLHFHGYHVKVVDYSKSSDWNGRIKDSVPIDAYETCTLLLVPQQPGTFPVHDHNLFAVSTGGYPGGMITHLTITP